MRWLLALVPVAIALEHFAPDRHLLVFLASALAIIPLAAEMGRTTEKLADRTGPGIGGLLNATLGNMAELIITLAALRAGMYTVVKAALAGAIVGNILFVLGAAMLLGGIRNHEQKYNAIAARSQSTMLTLATIALILPAAYAAARGPEASQKVASLSLWIAGVLLAVYALNLVYALVTHKELFAGSEEKHEGAHAAGGLGRTIVVLALVTAAIAWMSEILVGAAQPAGKELGLNDAFVGVFVVAVLGAAAEAVTAISAARKNQMDLAITIAVGASVQIALFVAPLLVILSRFMGPQPMDLTFSGGLVLTVLLGVMITGQVAADGRSDWLRGVQLLGVYAILGIVFLFAG